MPRRTAMTSDASGLTLASTFLKWPRWGGPLITCITHHISFLYAFVSYKNAVSICYQVKSFLVVYIGSLRSLKYPHSILGAFTSGKHPYQDRLVMAGQGRAAQKTLFLGTFIHCTSLEKLEYLHDSAVFVDEHGVIAAIEVNCDAKRAEESLFPKLNWSGQDVAIRIAKSGQFFFPGFIDTHIHASQYPNAGIFGKTTLLDWLNKYTFPLEASLSDTKKANTVYKRVIQRTLSHGTTTASYFATISVPSTNLLADLCLSYGQRAFIGRVCMDTHLQPDFYRDESAATSLSATKATISHITSIDPSHSLVCPIITPRFAPSCSSALMHSLGSLQKETDLPVQTHISENKNEIALVKKLFPDHASYTDVYDKHGLLCEKTILAHAVHISEAEADLIKERRAKISHCPASNSAITSGTAKVRWLLEKGIEVGLGTDMSGGYSPSILEAVRQALLVSRHVAMEGDDRTKLSIEEVLYLGTRGGAKVVGLPDRIGGFEVGMEWDAQLIGLGSVEEDDIDEGCVDIFGWEDWEERVAKWVFNGDDRNTFAVWVKGRLVHERRS